MSNLQIKSYPSQHTLTKIACGVSMYNYEISLHQVTIKYQLTRLNVLSKHPTLQEV